MHEQFKVFVGDAGERSGISHLAAQVESFVANRGVAAKSIGVEFLERSSKLVLTLGYREGEGTYPVRLTSHSLGTVDGREEDLGALEGRMTEAASSLHGVLCHELFVTDANEFVMVFLVRA